MRVWHLSLSLVMAAVSCGTEVVQVDLPAREDTVQSMLTGVLYDGRLSVYAIDLATDSTTWELPAVERRRGTVRFFTMHYERTLLQMQLRPGPQALVPDGTPPSAPDEIFQRTVRDEDEGRWAAVDQLSADLKFKFPKQALDQSKCRPLEISAHELPIDGRVTVALPQADGSIFAVGVGGQGLRIDDTGVSQLGQIVPDGVLSGVKTSSGVTWLSGDDGRLWSGRPGEGFEHVRTLAHGETTRYLAASTLGLSPPAPAELLILSRTGTFDHLSPWGWRPPQTLLEGASSQRRGGLLWLGLDRGAALVPGSGQYYRIDAGVVTYYEPPPERIGGVVDIAVNYGFVFGVTTNGYFIKYNEEPTLTLETQLDAALADPRLISLDDGFLVVHRPSTVRHWYRPSALDGEEGVVPPSIICKPTHSLLEDSLLWAHTIVGEKAYLFMSPLFDWDSGRATMLVVDFSRP